MRAGFSRPSVAVATDTWYRQRALNDGSSALPGRENHHHLPSFHLRILLQLGEGFRVLLHAGEQVHAQMLVRHFAAAEAQRDLDLVAVVEEALHRPHLHVVIVIVDGRAHLDLLDLDDLLLLAGLVGLFLLFVFVFAVIHQLADGRLVLGRDFDHVEAFFLAQGQSLFQADFAIFVPVDADQEDGAGGDFVVDARSAFGRGRGVLLKTSGDYDSLLLQAEGSFRSGPTAWAQAKQRSVMDRRVS